MKRTSWVIYVCAGCGEAIADGKQKHQPGCRDKRYEEIVVVPATEEQIEEHRAYRPSKKKSNPFTKGLKKG